VAREIKGTQTLRILQYIYSWWHTSSLKKLS